MVRNIGVAAAVALVALLTAPSASFAASKAKAKDSYRDVTKCEGGACTAVNPDRDFMSLKNGDVVSIGAISQEDRWHSRKRRITGTENSAGK